MLDKDGDLLSSKDEQLRRWKEHFSAVLNRVVSYESTPYAQDLPHCNPGRNIPTIALSKFEIYSAIKAFPSSEAAGIDGISADFYKAMLPNCFTLSSRNQG